MFLEDSVRISRQCSQIPCIRPDDMVFYPDTHQSSNIRLDDVIYGLDAQLSKASFVQTFLCVEKLRTVPTCIRPDVSAARLDDT